LSSYAQAGAHASTGQLGLFLIGLTASGLLMESGNATLAQLSGALSAVVAGLWLASILGLHESQWVWSTCPAFLLTTLLMLGRFYDYGNIPDSSFLLLATSPVWLSMGHSIVLRIRHRWIAVALRLLVTALPIAAAFALFAIARAGDSGQEALPY